MKAPPDGPGLVVPPDVARELLRPLVLGLAARVRADGTPLSARAIAFLRALHNAAEQPASSAPGTSPDAPATVEITAHQAAQLMGCSTEYVRRLARTGRVRARRAGPAWLIEATSLDAYRTGGTTCPPTSSPPGPASARPSPPA